MANFEISNPVYSANLRKLEPTDPNHADTFNEPLRQLLENDMAHNAQLAQNVYLQEAEPEAVHSNTVWYEVKSQINFSDGGVSIANAQTSSTPPESGLWFAVE